ncbi:MAG: ATP-utilizing chromatin assembly and remodelling N-terminal-domain-containing protein [Benjaminiella poitrasii]|nr:MAG: ATP-utilizing chromatin assembly and remodelling N-terminal-domain-containing protein [Benjaminiella poitrasii]
MPLLKRKRIEPIKLPAYDEHSKDYRKTNVWYSTLSNEIFTDYSEYIKRISLYRKPVWQCELTGKSNLTYRQALDSEKAEKEHVQDKFPEQLQKGVLLHVQFQTTRLDAVVDDAYQQFVNRYVEGEVLYCNWDGRHTVTVKVLNVVEKPRSVDEEGSKDQEEKEDNEYYKVKVISLKGFVKKDTIKIVPGNKLRRERYAFSKNLLKKFIKEYTEKDTYIGAPWVVRDDIAKRFGISTRLPSDLQAAKDLAYSKSKKRRNEAAAAVAAATAAAVKANSTGGEAKPITIDARKIESTLKYPIEDLNVPIYRRHPDGVGPIVDMTPGTKGVNTTAENPTGGMPLRPQPTNQSAIPNDSFGRFLMVWSFLSVFSQPLKLSPFSLDDFENALLHHGPSSIITESHVALLNAIIKQRDRLKKESLGHGSTAMAAAISLYGSGYQASRTIAPNPEQVFYQDSPSRYSSDNENEDDGHIWKVRPKVQRRESLAERGCGSIEVEAVGYNWDNGTVDTEEERIGWEDILIGFINQLAPLELLPDVDRILNHLVPSATSTLDEREQAYTSLSVRDKLIILELLLNVANESYVIKNYMDECQDQLTELRKQKIDLSRERRRIHAERRELENKQNEENNAQTPEPQETEESELDDDDDDDDTSDNEDNAVLKAQRKAEQLSRHELRLAALKRHQQERVEREAKRLKLHHLQREEARLRNQELKIRNATRKRLDEEERAMHKREEQIERDMRKYNNYRIKPLGRDKFYNRYYCLDDIGGTLLHGSGRLLVQSPSDTDLMVLQERDSIESIDPGVSLPCGRGGGVKFVSQLMKEQGLAKEAAFFDERIETLKKAGGPQTAKEWWQSYDEPEELQKLLEWLNPKGVREFRLKREIEKQLHNLTNGMKKRASDQQSSNKYELSRRTTRSKTTYQYPPGSWLAYTNKLV